MNHDVSHCLDYKAGKCPKKCYRAKVTQDLQDNFYPLPTSWANFKGTQYCVLTKKEKTDDG